MKKLLVATTFLGAVLAFPLPMMAGIDVGVSISLPPPIVFAAPPEVVVLPETYVYAVPDVDADMFFYNGWWWRLWDGRWYRSYRYDSGWAYYQSVPSFYAGIPPGWRNDFRDHRWRGHQWNYQRIPQQQVQRNWKGWEKSKHWEKQHTWGVQGLKPQTRSQRPAQPVQPKSQANPRNREVAKPQQQQHARPQPQSAKPQSREVKPQQARPQPQTAKPQSREAVRPQQQRPQPREAQPQHAQPQRREAPQQSAPRQGNPERGGEEKQERR
jgi:flagellar biosynthesis GTPase FlhF